MLVLVERVFSTFLSDWLRTEPRRPLVIRGARQVGKTWLVRDWAARERRALVEVNFERDPRLRRYFDQPDPRRIFDDLTLALEVAAAPEQAVLFLDEVQAAPEALAKLRWFAEEHPHLPVVAAGSLLEFGLADFAYSMPVGRIRYAYVEPLSFAEFLTAHGQTALRDRLARWRPEERLAAAVHDGAGRWYERYVMVGGMPAVVAQDTAGAPAAECRSLQRDLLQTYRDDFAKYAGRAEHGLLDSVLLAVVAALGGKFAYSRGQERRRRRDEEPAPVHVRETAPAGRAAGPEPSVTAAGRRPHHARESGSLPAPEPAALLGVARAAAGRSARLRRTPLTCRYVYSLAGPGPPGQCSIR